MQNNNSDKLQELLKSKPDIVVTNNDGLKEGWLIKMFPDYWKRFGGGPIYMTDTLATFIKDHNISEERLVDMWNNYVEFVHNIEPYLPSPLENDKVNKEIFVYHLQGTKLWVIRGGVTPETANAATFMFPEDY